MNCFTSISINIQNQDLYYTQILLCMQASKLLSILINYALLSEMARYYLSLQAIHNKIKQTIQIIIRQIEMGASCLSGTDASRDRRHCNCPQCTKCEKQFLADLRTLHKNYVPLVLHVRKTRLFEGRNDDLLKAVHKYFDDNFKVNVDDINVACVDMVRKLHPREYWYQKVDEQWLIQACLRQQKFADETKVEKVTFDHAYPEYLQFLHLCSINMKNKKITVPSKCQDIIWHSHMMDAENYKKDVQAYLGKLLNHSDDIPDEDLKKYSEQTNSLARKLRQQAKTSN